MPASCDDDVLTTAGTHSIGRSDHAPEPLAAQVATAEQAVSEAKAALTEAESITATLGATSETDLGQLITELRGLRDPS